MPAWSGLQSVTSVRIAELLAERFIGALHLRTQVKVA
jgi:hypothetical protein